jgi:DNA-binding response OmpR family regulator
MGLADQKRNAATRSNMENIVVIDDRRPVLKLLSTLCRAEGHVVRAFDNGHAGWEAIHEMVPDLALVDCRLGDVDGLMGKAGRGA